MNTQQKNKEKGFTIIEVVLVLAIAGLIFLMVFIALPALQRGQRDTQRRQDLSRVLTKTNDYQANNRGSLPSDWNSFKSQYLVVGGDTFTDPSGGDYTFQAHNSDVVSGSFSNDQHVIYYTTGATCTQDGGVAAASSRKIALRMILEGGGVACVNN